MKMKLTSQQSAMIRRAITWMISDLQYERHQALAHNCSAGSYDKEIEEYRQLKQYITDESLQG